ncbi:MAG: hypothetical protein M3N95_11560 [Actinomycetota bacterium]|nr:hypothetical protein [Actinomycetota bacterium]
MRTGGGQCWGDGHPADNAPVHVQVPVIESYSREHSGQRAAGDKHVAHRTTRVVHGLAAVRQVVVTVNGTPSSAMS